MTVPPSGRPAERVREQVRDHLQDAVAVGDDRRRLGILVEPEVDLAAPRLLAEARMRALDEHPHVDLLRVDREPVRVQLREVEHVADEPLEPDRLAGDDVERGALELRVVEEPVADRVDVTLDRGQRRPQLVRDRHQELPLALLGRGEPRGHLVEALGEVADLVVAVRGRHADGVVARPRSRRPPRASAVTGPVIFRDSHHESRPASTTPTRTATARRQTSGTHWSRSSVRGFATMIAPSASLSGSRRTGWAAAR